MTDFQNRQQIAQRASKRHWSPAAALLVLAAGMGLTLPASGQQPAPATPPKASPKAPAKAPPAGTPAAEPAPAARPPGDGALRQRVEQLEEQLADMQVVTGTLESFARTGAPAGGPSGGRPPQQMPIASGADAARVEALEAQVRQLSQQVNEMRELLRQQASIPPSPRAPQVAGSVATIAPPPTLPAPAVAPGAQPPPRGFGSTTVTPKEDATDPISRILAGNAPTAPGPRPPVAAAPLAPQGPVTNDPAARKQYDQAIGLLLQRDYVAAEAAFEDFLRRNPTDQRAGDAQFWLGETHFVRSNFRPAAAAFLKGYQGYPRSEKAPESLLKLALSLDAMGQKDNACASFGELNERFPSAPPHVRNRADSERRRLACP